MVSGKSHRNNNPKISFVFPENLVSATDYKLKFVVENQVKVESNFFLDVLGGNMPEITSSDQNLYQYGDTMILYGTNLEPGLAVYAHNASIYSYDDRFVTVNPEKTELTFPLDVNRNMFPNNSLSDFTTILQIHHQGKWGGRYVLEFD